MPEFAPVVTTIWAVAMVHDWNRLDGMVRRLLNDDHAPSSHQIGRTTDAAIGLP
ncbi:MAG: hypothetical protein OXU20_39330 [Myxococcales bacterium]|nr:hypothetical protein [Myxococcales bacterium]